MRITCFRQSAYLGVKLGANTIFISTLKDEKQLVLYVFVIILADEIYF